MNGILGQAEELARQRNAQYGMLRPEPSLMQRIGGQAKRLFFGDKNMYGNDPLQPSVMDSQYVRPEMAEGAVFDVVGGPMAVSRQMAKGMLANNPYLKGVKEGDELIGMHNLSGDNLAHVDKLGGLPVPSISIAKAKNPVDGFGDISLIPKQEMVAPSRGNPVYASDAYSKTYPRIDEDSGQIFRGFTQMGNRRYAPHTLENVVREMKGKVPNSEGWNYGVGNLKAEYTPKFRSMSGVQKSRDRIVSSDRMSPIKEDLNQRLGEITQELLPYDKWAKGNYEFGYADTVTARLSPNARLSDYYDDIPSDLMDKIYKFKDDLRNSPSGYFEVKPQRAVMLDEFGGAVVPYHASPESLSILKKHGIDDVEFYGESFGKQKTKADALERFKNLMFGAGGTAVALPVLSDRER